MRAWFHRSPGRICRVSRRLADGLLNVQSPGSNSGGGGGGGIRRYTGIPETRCVEISKCTYDTTVQQEASERDWSDRNVRESTALAGVEIRGGVFGAYEAYEAAEESVSRPS